MGILEKASRDAEKFVSTINRIGESSIVLKIVPKVERRLDATDVIRGRDAASSGDIVRGSEPPTGGLTRSSGGGGGGGRSRTVDSNMLAELIRLRNQGREDRVAIVRAIEGQGRTVANAVTRSKLRIDSSA